MSSAAGECPLGHTFVDTPEALSKFLDRLDELPKPDSTPSIYVDLEGINLSRDGSVSILQAMIPHTQHVYLLDIHVLGRDAFLMSSKSEILFKPSSPPRLSRKPSSTCALTLMPYTTTTASHSKVSTIFS